MRAFYVVFFCTQKSCYNNTEQRLYGRDKSDNQETERDTEVKTFLRNAKKNMLRDFCVWVSVCVCVYVFGFAFSANKHTEPI